MIAIAMLLVVMVVGAKFYALEFATITNHEMYPNLQPKTTVLICRVCRTYRRGDVVAFAHPEHGGQLALRRIIGLPTDTVAYRDGHLLINGAPLAVTPGVTATVETTSPRRTLTLQLAQERIDTARYEISLDKARVSVDMAPVTLTDAYFVLADNREHGRDSRNYGPITASMIRGKVIYP